jgi:hypothetical protein
MYDTTASAAPKRTSHPVSTVTYWFAPAARVELLRELVPSARRIAFFGNNQNSAQQIGFRGVQTASAEIGIEAVFVNAPSPASF